ncbi:HTH domain-containing protein [Pseudonocardia benzenivorans]
MTSSASRVLALLELLQARPGITGPELAQRLDVDARTVRRHVRTLEELGGPSSRAGAGTAATGCCPATGCRR